MLNIQNINKYHILGLTGNIGSGKSYVATVFSKLGIPVFDSDAAGRDILSHDKEAFQEIKKCFGEMVFTEGIPDRKKLAAIVFSDKIMLERLNSIIHPRVQKKFEEWLSMQKSSLVVREAAILIESGLKDVSSILVVTAPEAIRIRRVIKRDKVSESDVIKRIQNQMPESEKIKYADFIVRNDGKAAILPQVLEIVRKLGQKIIAL